MKTCVRSVGGRGRRWTYPRAAFLSVLIQAGTISPTGPSASQMSATTASSSDEEGSITSHRDDFNETSRILVGGDESSCDSSTTVTTATDLPTHRRSWDSIPPASTIANEVLDMVPQSTEPFSGRAEVGHSSWATDFWITFINGIPVLGKQEERGWYESLATWHELPEACAKPPSLEKPTRKYVTAEGEVEITVEAGAPDELVYKMSQGETVVREVKVLRGTIGEGMCIDPLDKALEPAANLTWRRWITLAENPVDIYERIEDLLAHDRLKHLTQQHEWRALMQQLRGNFWRRYNSRKNWILCAHKRSAYILHVAFSNPMNPATTRGRVAYIDVENPIKCQIFNAGAIKTISPSKLVAILRLPQRFPFSTNTRATSLDAALPLFIQLSRAFGPIESIRSSQYEFQDTDYIRTVVQAAYEGGAHVEFCLDRSLICCFLRIYEP